MKSCVVSCLAFLFAVIASSLASSVPKAEHEKKAVCRFAMGEVTGMLVLTQVENQELHIKGLLNHIEKDGLHGFHAHEFGNLTDQCKAAGKHFNPLNTTHGPPTNSKDQRHMGDFGNIQVIKGKATVDYTDKVASIFGPPEMSLMSRALVIHKNADDLTTNGDGLGNAGDRIGCCIITSGSRFGHASNDVIILGTFLMTMVSFLM